MTALDELLERTIDTGEDRLEWLRARQGRMTASMVSKFLSGGAAARREVLEESFKPPVEIVGNKYIDRGHEREPVIAAWIQQHWPSIEPNVRLFAAKDNARHAATPDGIGLHPDGWLVLAEIKTSKYDRHPESVYFAQTGYREQMQWQMYVTGAVATLFVWEQHDDDWDNGPTPLHDEPRFVWFKRDEELIARLVAAANLALAERDAMAAAIEAEAPEPVDEVLADLAAQVLEARKEEAAAKARLKAPWTRLLTEVADREEFSSKQGRAMVTWSNRTVTEQRPDVEAALRAEIGFGETGSTLRDRADAARAEWEDHLAKYTMTVERVVQKLTVTEPKPKKDAEFEGEF